MYEYLKKIFVKTRMDFLVIPKITTDLKSSLSIAISRQNLPYVKLANNRFNIPEHVAMLLGTGIFMNILEQDKLMSISTVLFCKTLFSILVSGCFSTKKMKSRFTVGLQTKKTTWAKSLKNSWR